MSGHGDRKQPRWKRHRIELDRERIRTESFEAIHRLREQQGVDPSASASAPVPPTPPAKRPGRPPVPEAERGRRRWILRWSLALNVALVLAAIIASQTTRLQPTANLIIQDRTLAVVEADGTEKWRHEFPASVQFARIAPWTKVARYLVVAIWDEEFGPGQLVQFDIRKDEEIWQRTVDMADIVPRFGEEMTRTGEMWCPTFTFVDLEGDGEAEVAAAFHHRYYLPACVRTYSREGDTLGTYYHWGYINALHAHDLDGDGRQELLAGGTNNARGVQGATIVLLDRSHLSGYSSDASIPHFAEHPEGARIRVVLPAWDRGVMDLIPLERLAFRQLLINGQGRGSVVTGKLALGNSGFPVHFDAELHPIDTIPPGYVMTLGRKWFDEGKTTIDISENRFWTDWLARCMRFGAPDPPS